MNKIRERCTKEKYYISKSQEATKNKEKNQCYHRSKPKDEKNNPEYKQHICIEYIYIYIYIYTL